MSLPRLLLGIVPDLRQVVILGFGWTVEECDQKAAELKPATGVSEHRSFKIGDYLGTDIDRWLLLKQIAPSDRAIVIQKIGKVVLELLEQSKEQEDATNAEP